MRRIDWITIRDDVLVLTEVLLIGWLQGLAPLRLTLQCNKMLFLVWAEVDAAGVLRVERNAMHNQIL